MNLKFQKSEKTAVTAVQPIENSTPFARQIAEANQLFDELLTPKEAALKKSITYRELSQVLTQLDFFDHSDNLNFRFTQKTKLIKIKCTVRPLDTWLTEKDTAKLAKLLASKGAIVQKEDLLRMVRRNRLDALLLEADKQIKTEQRSFSH